MKLTRVVVDPIVLKQFKKRCIADYPKEHIEAAMGRVHGSVVYIHAFDPIIPKVTTNRFLIYDRPGEEIEAGTNLKFLGTIHTHPNALLEASADDWYQFLADTDAGRAEIQTQKSYDTIITDTIMGIMSIIKRRGRFFTGFIFYNLDKKVMDFLVGEPLKPKKNKKT
jgi:hypothetical protein